MPAFPGDVAEGTGSSSSGDGGSDGDGSAGAVATVSANLGLNELFSESANFATAVTFIQPSDRGGPFADAALLLLNFGKRHIECRAGKCGVWFIVPVVWWRSITASTATTITLDYIKRNMRDFVTRYGVRRNPTVTRPLHRPNS